MTSKFIQDLALDATLLIFFNIIWITYSRSKESTEESGFGYVKSGSAPTY